MKTRQALSTAALVLGILSFGAGGCFLGRSTPATAEEIASRRVARATGRAASHAARIDEMQTELRLNPAACDCPEWELWLRGRWTRAELLLPEEGTAPALSALSPGDTLAATVRSTGDVVTAADGWPYPVFEWLSAPTN